MHAGRLCSRCLAAFTVFVAILFSMPAALAQAKFQFDIPAQALGDTLRAVGRTTGTNILFEPQLVAGKTAKAISGQYTVDEAITQAVGNVPLETKRSGDNTIIIKETTVKAESTQKSDVENIEGVVVTAQKRRERLIDVPQSVSVLTGQDLSKMGALQFRDYANTIPGLTFTTYGAGETQITLRGVTSGLDISPTTTVYVDDVPVGGGLGGALLTLDASLFDIDRIEVLRGPQGTLYGASTMGGLIKYVSKRPSFSGVSGEAVAGVSSTQDGGIGYNAGAAVNIPLKDNVAALRVSGFETHAGGYIDNAAQNQKDVNRSDVYGGRVDLLLTPTDRLSFRLSGLLQNTTRNGEGTAEYKYTGTPPGFDGTPLLGALIQNRAVPEPFSQHFQVLSGTAEYEFDSAKLTSITSNQTIRTEIVRDATPIYAPLVSGAFGIPVSGVAVAQGMGSDKFTEEIRLQSARSGSLEWLLGAFYTKESSSNTSAFVLLDPSGKPAPNTLLSSSVPIGYTEYSVFGNVTWHLNRQFDVSGGLRYAHDHVETSQTGSGILGVSQPGTESTEHKFTYLANARYHFDDHTTAYVRYATGFRPGGPNTLVKDPTTGLLVGTASYQSDKLASYEAGIKAETPDRRYAIDFAVYYIDWKDIQVSHVQGGFSGTINAAGGATIRGSELTLTATPIKQFTASGAFAFQNATMNQANADLGAAAGERLPNVPRFTAALNADYLFANDGLRPTLGATLRYVGDRHASFDASAGYPQYHLPSYTTFDIRSGLTARTIQFQLYIHNLFNERGQLSAIAALGPPRVGIIEPRTIGVSATAPF